MKSAGLISRVNYLSLSKTNVTWYNLDGTGWSLHKEGEISIVSPEYPRNTRPSNKQPLLKSSGNKNATGAI